MAWFHHRGRNRHHYEYWVDYLDKGGIPAIMPFKYALEMVCDYLAAGNAYSGKNFTLQGELEWWENKKKTHPKMALETRLFVDFLMQTMASENNTHVLRKDIAITFYEKALNDAKSMKMICVDTSGSMFDASGTMNYGLAGKKFEDVIKETIQTAKNLQTAN